MIGGLLAAAVAKIGTRRLAAIGGGLVLVLVLLFALKACDRHAAQLVETATERGRLSERAASNERVISDAEKVAAADAAGRARSVDERMRDDPNCRDCADGQ